MDKRKSLKFKRYKDKLGRPEEIKPVLDRCLNRIAKPEYALLTKLWQHWDMVMGDEIASLASPLGCKDGVLFLGAEDAMSAQDLSYMSFEIIDRVNAFMESNFLKDVKVRLCLDKSALNEVVKKPTLIDSYVRLDLKGSKLSGKYLSDMDENSPVARCYARFVKASQKN